MKFIRFGWLLLISVHSLSCSVPIEKMLPPNLSDAVQLALKEFSKEPNQNRADIFYTRDFWGSDWIEADMDAAYDLAEKKWHEAVPILENSFGKEGMPIKQSDPGFEWLTAEEGYFWKTEYGNIILFWEHEDKELPCVVQLYRYTSPESNEMKRWFIQNEHVEKLYFGISDEEKISMLKSSSTSDADWVLLYEYCRAFPRKAVVEAARTHLNRLKNIPYNYSREQMDEMLLEGVEDINLWGDACHPGSTEEMLRIMDMNEIDIIAYLDSNETSTPWLRSRAILQLYNFPTDKMIAAVRRNWHKPHDRRQVPELEELINIAQSKDW